MPRHYEIGNYDKQYLLIECTIKEICYPEYSSKSVETTGADLAVRQLSRMA